MVTLLLSLMTGAIGSSASAPTAAPARPNFVVIIADDLDVSSVPYMSAVEKSLVSQGESFTRYFATTPLCCPSRASMLRGQYAHNHGVLRNTGENAGFAAFHDAGLEQSTLATELHSAGYQTALIGKYLNGYSLKGDQQLYIPPGWDFWAAAISHAAYGEFNYELNVNGRLVPHGHRDRDYLTDVLGSYALDFLDQAGSAGAPFFLYLTPFAPHSPATPAPRHRGMFGSVQAPRPPSFNERDVSDKPDWIRGNLSLSDEKIHRIDADYRRRLQSLQAVDEMVDAMMSNLERRGLLDSTYILFMSDNGYFLGEHRQPHGKDAPYDAATRIPLVVRGPGVLANSHSDQIVLNIDLMPTLLDLADVPAPSYVDGRSMAPLFSGPQRDWRTTTLLEGFGNETESNEGDETSAPAFHALRSADVLYIEDDGGERELYDLRDDPFELTNKAKAVGKDALRPLSRHLQALATCAGATCRELENQSLPSPFAQKANASRERRGKHDSAPHRDRSSRHRDSQQSSTTRKWHFGDRSGPTSMLQFDVPQTAIGKDHMALALHVAAVTHPGSLVATLNGSDSPMLGQAAITRAGWVRLATPTILRQGSATITLRASKGSDFVISSPESKHPPRLIFSSGALEPDQAGISKARARSHRHRHQGRG
jgi:arylsulfatase A-like enzyme